MRKQEMNMDRKFEERTTTPPDDQHHYGMEHWGFVTNDGTMVRVLDDGYYLPEEALVGKNDQLDKGDHLYGMGWDDTCIFTSGDARQKCSINRMPRSTGKNAQKLGLIVADNTNEPSGGFPHD